MATGHLLALIAVGVRMVVAPRTRWAGPPWCRRPLQPDHDSHSDSLSDCCSDSCCGSARPREPARRSTRRSTRRPSRRPGRRLTRRLTRSSSPGLPTGAWQRLTDEEATRIAAAIAATHAEATRTAYAHAWSHWVRWCDGRGLAGFPAEPALVCAYLTERAGQGLAFSTIDQACSAIGYQHRRRGLPDPLEDPTVRQVRRGLRRLLGTAPRRPARPLSIRELRQIITSIDRSTARGVRDTAIILLGFGGALRRSEVAALTTADLEATPAGLLVHLRRSKTDPEGRGQVIGIAHGQHPLTDPVTALAAWFAVRGTAPGPLFTSLRPGTTAAPADHGGHRLEDRQEPRRRRRTTRRTVHRPLAARRTRHQRRRSRRQHREDRRPDPAPPHRRPHRALHPPRPSAAHHLQPRPGAMTTSGKGPVPLQVTGEQSGHLVRPIGDVGR